MKQILTLVAQCATAFAGQFFVHTALPQHCTRPREIALTFDDGPGSSTLAVLDVLKKANVTATFHVAVQMLSNARQQSAVRRAVSEGHLMGLRFDPRISIQELKSMSNETLHEKLVQDSQMLHRVAGVYPRFIRMPFGFRKLDQNAMPMRILKTFGFIPTVWNVDSHDYVKSINVKEIVLKSYRPMLDGGGGSYVVLHRDLFDIGEAVKSGIELVKQNHTFVNLGQCLGIPLVYKSDVEGLKPLVDIKGKAAVAKKDDDDGKKQGGTTDDADNKAKADKEKGDGKETTTAAKDGEKDGTGNEGTRSDEEKAGNRNTPTAANTQEEPKSSGAMVHVSAFMTVLVLSLAF